MAAKPDIMKFRFAEMFSDRDGKTSITKFMGFLIIFVGLISFMYVVFYEVKIERLNLISYQSIGLVTIGSGLLVGKIIQNRKKNESE